MGKIYFIFLAFVIVSGCTAAIEDTFNSEEITSSKGEKIYVNSLNWGVTGDYQISAVSANKQALQKRTDTMQMNIAKGLEPFIYVFKNDTLNLFFDGEADYRINESFKTISIQYVALDKKAYRTVRVKAYDNAEGYHTVPKRKNTNYPSDMPKPSGK